MSQIETQQTAVLGLLSADVRGEGRSEVAIYPQAAAPGESKSQWLVRARDANLRILQGTRLSEPVKIPSAGNHNIEDTLGGV